MTQDTRKDRRVKIVSLNVRYKSATVDEFIENHAHDVSRGGIFIKTANPFPSGTLLKFEIRLASDQAVIAGVGRVVWKRDAGVLGEHPSGMGVKFIKIDDPSKVVIDRLVNTREDAGKAYENEGGTVSSDPAASLQSMPPRSPLPPAVSPPRATGARSMSPGTGMPAPAKVAASTPPGSPLARKGTIMGMGASKAPPSPSSPPGSPSSPPFGRSPLTPISSVPPRPGVPSPMFPRLDADDPHAAKQEPTVMKQAAELLEEALREAGGSMDEIGSNPLFSVSGEARSADAPELSSPATPGSEWTTADTPQALAASVAARRAVEAAALEHGVQRRSGSQKISEAASTDTQPRSVVPRAAGASSTAKKKGGSGTFIFAGVAAAAVLAGVMVFRDELFGEAARPEPVSTPSVARPPLATTPAVSAAPTEIRPAATPAPLPSSMHAAASAPTMSATVSPPAIAGASGMTAAAAAPPPPRPPKPAARPAPAALPPTAAPAGTESVTAAVPTESTPAAAASQTKPAPPPPKQKPAKQPADDNPY
jgi:uncharacterized protein (TIGR02266 family)